jgi:FAD/FMN-containing dehydrogenase
MKEILVDPAARTAAAGAGLLWRELDTATQAYGLATTGGVDGTTGIAGLTLGGGIGWLDRLAGLTCDNLLSADVVTADGRVLRASADTHPDLFWALRGGGGNFGVVISFTYQLHAVTEVYGGLLGYPTDRAAEVLQAYREFSAGAPDRLALYAGLVTAPPAPFVPEHLRGQRVAGLIPVYFGAAKEAVRVLAPLLAAAPPVLDLTKPMSYQEAQQLTDGLNPPGMHHYYTAEWLHGLDDQTIEETVAAAADAPSPLSAVIFKRMGGTTARVPADATAFWYRHTTWTSTRSGHPAAHQSRTSRGRGPPGGRLSAIRPAAATSTSSAPTRPPTGYARRMAATTPGWPGSRPPTTRTISSASTTTSRPPSRRETGPGRQSARADAGAHTCQRLGPPGAGS